MPPMWLPAWVTATRACQRKTRKQLRGEQLGSCFGGGRAPGCGSRGYDKHLVYSSIITCLLPAEKYFIFYMKTVFVFFSCLTKWTEWSSVSCRPTTTRWWPSSSIWMEITQTTSPPSWWVKETLQTWNAASLVCFALIYLTFWTAARSIWCQESWMSAV